MGTVKTFKDDRKSLPSCSDSRDYKVPLGRSSKCRLKRFHSKRRNKRVKRHSYSSKLSREKFESCSETECEDDEQSTPKRHIHYRRARGYVTDTDSWVDCHKKSRRRRDKEVSVVCTINQRFQEALNYRKYRLADNLPQYEDHVAQSVHK